MNINAMKNMVERERDLMVLERIGQDGASYEELGKELGLSAEKVREIYRHVVNSLKKKARQALKDTDALDALRCHQYVLDVFGIHLSLEELRSLAEDHRWFGNEGMAFSDLDKIPVYYGLEVRVGQYTLEGLTKAIDQGSQLLVAVDGGELMGNPLEEILEDAMAEIADHVVVVLGMSPAGNEVALFDPAFGTKPLVVTPEKFLDAWHDSGCLTVEISRPA